MIEDGSAAAFCVFASLTAHILCRFPTGRFELEDVDGGDAWLVQTAPPPVLCRFPTAAALFEPKFGIENCGLLGEATSGLCDSGSGFSYSEPLTFSLWKRAAADCLRDDREGEGVSTGAMRNSMSSGMTFSSVSSRLACCICCQSEYDLASQREERRARMQTIMPTRGCSNYTLLCTPPAHPSSCLLPRHDLGRH